MGPRKNVNEKAEAAKERKAAAKDEAGRRAAKDAEDAYWRSAGEGSKTKAQAKRDADDAKRAEAAARKAELKRLQEEEERALAKPTKPAGSKNPNRVSGPKVTHHELHKLREQEAEQREQEQRERDLAARREVAADAYARAVDLTQNTNRADDVVEASGVEQAIDALAALRVAAEASPGGDKHPEKRMRAAWKAYEEHQLPLLRMEKPNLKQSQYREMLWKMWQKAPENPMNQQPPA